MRGHGREVGDAAGLETWRADPRSGPLCIGKDVLPTSSALK